MLDAAPDAILAIGGDGRVVLANRRAASLFGYAPGELTGQPADRLVPRIGAGRALVGRRKDGTGFPVDVAFAEEPEGTDDPLRIVSVRAGDGAPTGLLASLVHSWPDAVAAMTVDAVVASWNPGAEGLLGFTADEIVGRHVGALWPPARKATEERVIERVARGERPVRYRSELVHRNGGVVPVSVRQAPIVDDTGAVIGICLTMQPPGEEGRAARAERERLEARLAQSERLESLGQLAGGVAHDFNNLLAVIVNYAAFVAEEVETAAIADPDRWHTVARDVQQIQRATEKGITLTHQLLAFGRREVVRPQVLSFNTVVTEVQQLLQRSIGEHVELVTSLAPGLWRVRADPGQMEQVLVNLAVNARDAMPGGGTLTIDTANAVLDAASAGARPGLEPGRYVRISVTDTGCGMPADVAERAFEPFFTTKPKGEGTGLGLATVYGVMAQAGGEVNIYSEPGVGTTFHLLLPASDEAAEEPERAPEPVRVPDGGGETILVVEDEPAIREVTLRILQRHGYEVIVAATGLEALELVEHHPGPVDLLMTDVVMPQMLGREVAERLRALRPELKVVYMSGYARPVLASTGTLDGEVPLLEKPFSESALLELVRRVIDGSPDAASGGHRAG